MNMPSRVLGRSAEDLQAIAMQFRPTQSPTNITLYGDSAQAVYFDEAFLGARATAASATPLAHSRSPIIGLTSDFVTLGDDWEIAMRPEPDQGLVIEGGEWARRAFDLNVDQLGALAGGSGRRYQEYRNGQVMPPQKIAQLWDSLSVVVQLGKIDPWATKTLFQVDEGAMECLNNHDVDGLWAKFTELRGRLAQARHTFVRRLEFIAQDDNLSRIRSLARTDDFDKALRLLEGLVPDTHAWSQKWRVLAGLDLLEAIRLYDRENEVTEAWEFLAAFGDEQLRAFQDQAISVIGNPHTSETEWKAWLGGQTETAAASIPRVELAPPVTLPTSGGSDLIGIADLIADGRSYTLPKLNPGH